MENQPYFTTDTLRIYHADILTTECVAADSVDLIVTSPPYNVDIPYGAHDDQMTYDDYLAFTRAWIAKCYRL